MSKILTPEDHEAVGEILDIAYGSIQSMPLTGLIGGHSGERTPEVIGVSGVCMEMSDAVTRAAHQLGVVASRERRKGHFITSLAPLDVPLGDEDLIICTTWGQFSPERFWQDPQPFFGPRIAMKGTVGIDWYDFGYAKETIKERQIAHMPPFEFSRAEHPEHYWLATTPEQVLSGEFPMGPAKKEDFPLNMWD